MPITKSAAKRMHQSVGRRKRNRSVKAEIRTERVSVDSLVGETDVAKRKAGFSEYSSLLDKAVKKGMIKKNTADRSKSRAAKRLSLPA